MATTVFDTAINLFFPAIVTPLHPNGSIDCISARRLCVAMLKAGAGGLYVLGNTGEGMHLSESCRMLMAEIVMEEIARAGMVHICVIHIGCAEPTAALRLAQHAKDIGAHAVSSLPPFVSHNSFEYTVSFYEELARSVSPVPVIAYHIPSVTGSNLSVHELVKILAIDGVVGFKFTDMDLNKMDCLLSQCPNAILFHGVSPMQTAALMYGARGGITGASNCLCTPLVKVHELAKNGLYSDAMSMYQRPFNRSNEVLNSNGKKQVQGFKHLLYWQGIIEYVTCAAREDMTEAEISSFRAKCAADPLLGPTLIRS